MTVVSAEANVLHAALDEDTEKVRALLRDFYPGELRGLRSACRMVIDQTYIVGAEVQQRFDATQGETS